MAVKVVRQQKSIALIGAPTSAAALAAGHERAPAALRAAGLSERLREAGFAVTDQGDCAARVFQVDDEHSRARNVVNVLAALEELRPRIELAIKSGALPLILGGDCSILLATVAGARRYLRNVSVVYLDRDAGLNVPATTPTGSVDGMVISHAVGRGAPELVRFWGEPPLVREPDILLFGVEQPSEPEQRFLTRSPLLRYLAEDIHRKGATAAAEEAIERLHGGRHEFILHVDLDVIAAEDFRATNNSGSGGLRLDEVRQALAVFARKPALAALEIAAYNPALDPDGSAAKQVIDLIVEVLSPRLQPAAPAEEAPAAREQAGEPRAMPPSPPDSDASSFPASAPAKAASADAPPAEPDASA